MAAVSIHRTIYSHYITLYYTILCLDSVSKLPSWAIGYGYGHGYCYGHCYGLFFFFFFGFRFAHSPFPMSEMRWIGYMTLHCNIAYTIHPLYFRCTSNSQMSCLTDMPNIGGQGRAGQGSWVHGASLDVGLASRFPTLASRPVWFFFSLWGRRRRINRTDDRIGRCHTISILHQRSTASPSLCCWLVGWLV